MLTGPAMPDGQTTNGAAKRPFDLAAIRADFPILATEIYGKRLAFLDSAASAQKPRSVIDSDVKLYETSYANIHRGVYKFSQDATEAYEQARLKVQAFMGAASHREIIFVRGATEGINLVAQSWGRANLKAGDEIILTELEHHSNIVPWQMVAEEKGAVIKVVPVLDDGSVDHQAYLDLLGPNTKIAAFAHISNAIGTELPVKAMVKAAHDVGALTLVDGCQAAPHIPIDMADLDADFYVFSGHKTYGPTGIGVLYGKQALLDAMPPWQGGGDMIETVSFAGTTYNDLPHKFEAGTPHIAGGIGLGAALDYLTSFDWEDITAHEADLMAYAKEQLSQINSLKIIGAETERKAVISLVMAEAHPHDIGTILDRAGVAVRAGHHCAQPVMDRFSIPGTARVSFGLYNGRDDVDQLVLGLEKVREFFG